MAPAEYLEVVVLPTVREFLAQPDDRRLAYLSTISVFHVTDYLMRLAAPPNRASRIAEIERISDLIRVRCPDAFDVVEGMCNGSKHCGRNKPNAAQFKPGDEEKVAVFTLDSHEAGLDRGRLDRPGLIVEVRPGNKQWVDDSIRLFLKEMVAEFPSDLGGVDLSGI